MLQQVERGRGAHPARPFGLEPEGIPRLQHIPAARPYREPVMQADAPALERSGVTWALVTAGGLFVAITGVMMSSARQGAVGSGVRLVLGLPGAVGLAILAALAVAALLMLILLWPRDGRRRKKNEEDDAVFVDVPPKVPAWVWVALAVSAMLPLAVTGGFLWSKRVAILDGAGAPVSVNAPSASAVRSPDAAKPTRPEAPTVSMPAFDVAVAVVASAVALAMLSLMVWLQFGDRLSRWCAGRVFGDSREPSRAAVAESLDDLRAEPDARRAIIACYRRFERAVAASGVTRAPWQTATEFMQSVLDRLALPRPAVARLIELFQISRFSRRHVGASERDVACNCLEQIRLALETEADRAATA